MKILVPINGSPSSENSIAFLASRTSLFESMLEVELVVVLEPIPELLQLQGKDLENFCKEEVEEIFTPVRKQLNDRQIRLTESILRGDPATQIADEAERCGADLIVMGSRGHTALTGLFLGSVTSEVLSRTKLPMLILRNSRLPQVTPVKVGIAVDGSPYSMAAVRYVLKDRELFGRNAEFSLIHVASDFASTVYPDVSGMALPAFSDEEIRALQEKEFAEIAEPLLALFSEAGIQPRLVNLAGNPGDEIAAYAKNEGLGVIVMGSHGYGRIQSAVMGSTAMRIASQGDIPLLVIQE